MSCYDCKFKGSVPGSVHSSCKVISDTVSDKSKGFELEILLASHQITLTDGDKNHIVQLNEHGIKNGWANWPLDFDPTWVEDCRFFTQK